MNKDEIFGILFRCKLVCVFGYRKRNLIQYDFVVALKRTLTVRRVSLPKSFRCFVNHCTNKLKEGLQSNLDYPDSLEPHELVRIIEGPDNRKYE